MKLIRDDLLLGSGIRVERAVLKNMMLWTEMGVNVGGEARHGVLLSLDLLELLHQMLLLRNRRRLSVFHCSDAFPFLSLPEGTPTSKLLHLN